VLGQIDGAQRVELRDPESRRGATRGAAKFVAPVAAALSPAEEQQRLTRLPRPRHREAHWRMHPLDLSRPK
jgi:hypothetical protein